MKKRKIYHTTRGGTKIPIHEMTDQHLINTIKWQRRKAAEGLTVRYGGIGIADDEPWYDEDHLTGKDALHYLCHEEYVAEAHRRALPLEHSALAG